MISVEANDYLDLSVKTVKYNRRLAFAYSSHFVNKKPPKQYQDSLSDGTEIARLILHSMVDGSAICAIASRKRMNAVLTKPSCSVTCSAPSSSVEPGMPFKVSMFAFMKGALEVISFVVHSTVDRILSLTAPTRDRVITAFGPVRRIVFGSRNIPFWHFLAEKRESIIDSVHFKCSAPS